MNKMLGVEFFALILVILTFDITNLVQHFRFDEYKKAGLSEKKSKCYANVNKNSPFLAFLGTFLLLFKSENKQ